MNVKIITWMGVLSRFDMTAAGPRRALFIVYPVVVILICIRFWKMGGFARVSKVQ